LPKTGAFVVAVCVHQGNTIFIGTAARTNFFGSVVRQKIFDR
jgi:hypothetical protein